MYQQLREALTRVYIDTRLAGKEQKLAGELTRLFKRQGAFVVRRLKTHQSVFSEAFTDNQIKGLLNNGLSQAMVKAIEASVKWSYVAGADDLLADIKMDISFSLDNPRAVAYIKDYGANLIKGIDETTRNDIKSIVTKAIDEGSSYIAVAKEIKTLFDGYSDHRTQLIAVTELGNGYQAGSFAAVQEATDTGLTFEKSWLTSNDDRVTDGCRINQSEGWIDQDKAFTSGHMHPLRFPGCRCVCQYRRKKT